LLSGKKLENFGNIDQYSECLSTSSPPGELSEPNLWGNVYKVCNLYTLPMGSPAVGVEVRKKRFEILPKVELLIFGKIYFTKRGISPWDPRGLLSGGYVVYIWCIGYMPWVLGMNDQMARVGNI